MYLETRHWRTPCLWASSAFAILAAFAPAAFAQDSQQREEIIVTAPVPLTAAQTVTPVDPIQLQESPSFSIGQILQFSPGVSIKQGNGPRDVGISIRGSNARNGFGVRNIQMFEDGFPVTQPDGLSRTDITDPHAYAGIDVYQGPSSSLFGNYATGGAIDFHTRSGGDIDGVELSSDGGSFGYYNGYLTFGAKGDDYEYAAFGSHVRGNGFQDNSAYRTTTENILATFALDDDNRLVVKIINNDLDARLPIRLSLNQYGLNPFQRGCHSAGPTAVSLGCASVNLFANGKTGTTVAQSAGQAGLGRTDRRTIGGLRWEHDIADGTGFRLQGVVDVKDINQPTGATSAQGATPAFNLMADVTSQGSAFGLDATHYAGLFLNYEDLNSYTYNLAPGGDATLGAKTANYFGHHTNFGARAREELQLAEGWTAIVGLGVEKTDLSALNTAYAYNAAGVATPAQLSVQRSFVNVAPEASLQYRPDRDWRLHARVATAYGTPQASNLFVTAGGVNGNNTQLDSQSNVGFDLGADWSPSNDVKLGLLGFYEFFHNELVTQSPGAGLQSFTFNAPASEHRGVEASADWRPAGGFRVTATYTYQDQIYTDYRERLSAGTRTALFDRAGKNIPGIEPDNVSLRAGYDSKDGPAAGLGGFVEFNWRDAFFVDNANLALAPGYRLVNVNLHYDAANAVDWLAGVKLFVEVQNIFDTTYVASANTVSDSLSAATGLQNPAANVLAATGSVYAGAPRTFLGGMRVKF